MGDKRLTDSAATGNQEIDSTPSNARLGDFLTMYGPIMMQVVDREHRILEVNRCWLERLGYSVDQVIGRPVTDFLTPTSAEQFLREFKGLFERDSFQGVRRDLLTAAGEVVFAEVNGRHAKGAQGEPLCIVSALVDVTERIRREEEQLAREEELRLLIEHSPEGIMIHQNGKYVYANKQACVILGARGPEELLGRESLSIVHPDVRPAVIERLKRLNAMGGQSRPSETLFCKVNGEGIFVESTGTAVTYKGQFAIQLVFRDISDRKTAESIARQNEVQEEVIRAQREMLLAVSTPLLPLRDNVILMPLVGSLDEARTDRATQTLLEGIGKHSARVAILDVTGVPEVGAGMAEGLRRTIYAAQLLGAEVVVTGIQAAIAKTMIEMGFDMSGIVTRGTLRDGIAYAFKRAR